MVEDEPGAFPLLPGVSKLASGLLGVVGALVLRIGGILRFPSGSGLRGSRTELSRDSNGGCGGGCILAPPGLVVVWRGWREKYPPLLNCCSRPGEAEAWPIGTGGSVVDRCCGNVLNGDVSPDL